MKAGVEADDGAEDGDGDAGDDDGRRPGAEPDDEQRGECGFRQTVQDDQIRLQNLRQLSGVPEQRRDQQTEADHEQEARNGLEQGDADVREHMVCTKLFDEAQHHAARTGKEEAVDPAEGCAGFPQGKKEREDEKTPGGYLVMMAPVFPDKKLLTGQFMSLICFHVSNPPIAC